MSVFFFFNDTATTEIYTLSLHDALPISLERIPRLARKSLPLRGVSKGRPFLVPLRDALIAQHVGKVRSEEHTSELQSRLHLVCRLLLEKKKRDKHAMCHYPPRGRCSQPT